jgi:hypothetical protein
MYTQGQFYAGKRVAQYLSADVLAGPQPDLYGEDQYLPLQSRAVGLADVIIEKAAQIFECHQPLRSIGIDLVPFWQIKEGARPSACFGWPDGSEFFIAAPNRIYVDENYICRPRRPNFKFTVIFYFYVRLFCGLFRHK